VTEVQLQALLVWLTEHDGSVDHRATKQLGLSMSQLNRALALLTDAAALGGQPWVRTQDDGQRRTLWLTDAGRQVCATTTRAGAMVVHALRIDAAGTAEREEWLAEEVPVALVYNGISHAVMMASPLDLEDFALGFSLSEGIIEQAGELLDCEISSSVQGISVGLQIREARFQALKQRRRALTGRTGCGLCGQESLEGAIRPVAKVEADWQVHADVVRAGMAALAAQQPLNVQTGAAHAAGWWRHGVLIVREDVGRHNALDKLIGAIARQPERDGVLLMTSRASYEIVHKAAAAGIAVVAAISAPTALAVQLADEAGITLAGFVRGERMTVYSHPQRIVCESP
jgi:formate dehydrogenase accessory protein FdhD